LFSYKPYFANLSHHFDDFPMLEDLLFLQDFLVARFAMEVFLPYGYHAHLLWKIIPFKIE
jgi:hypothetical protein